MASQYRALVCVLLCVLGEAIQPLPHREKPNSQLNLCMSGRIAPELFLMGAAKAGSSTFAANFALSPNVKFPDCIEYFPNEDSCKEVHYFGNEEAMAMGKINWLKHYPECSQDVRIVTTDLSPRYHFHPEVPGQLRQYYGSYISRVVFLTLLREPVSLMQSHFYFNGVDKTEHRSFSDWMFELTNLPSGPEGPEYENAMYAVSLSRLFETLNRAQFVICPYRYSYAGRGSTPPVFEWLWERFGLQAPNDYTGKATIRNVASHPDLSEEMDAESLEQIKAFFYNISGSSVLANLFAASSPQDAPHLHGYEGTPNQILAIKSWIEEGW